MTFDIRAMPLEELNDKLHGRDVHLNRTRNPDVFRPEENQTGEAAAARFQATETWNQASLPPKPGAFIPEPVRAVVASDDRGKRRRKLLAILAGSFAFLLLVGGLAMKMRTSLFTEENIVVSMVNPAEVASAEAISFDFEYANNNWMALENATLVFEYPESFHPNPMPKLTVKKSRAELALGTIASQTRGKVTLSGQFYGSRGDQVKVRGILQYSASAFSAKYEKQVDRLVTLTSSSLFFEIKAPLELVSDQEAQYEIRYGNVGNIALSDLKVKLQYPPEFTFGEADPKPSVGNTLWQVGTLEPKQEGVIVVRGRITGLRDEQKLIQGGIGVVQGDGNFLAYGENSRKTKIVASPFSIRQSVNGQPSVSVDPGSVLFYEIEYRNEANVGIRDAIITMNLDSPYLDFSTLQFDTSGSRGAYDQSRRALYWKASALPGLSRVEPGQSGRVSFQIKTLADMEQRFPTVRNPVITSVATIDSTDIPAIVGFVKVVASATLSLKLNTLLTSTFEGKYYDSVIPNSGPVPPVVGQETTYTFHVALKNTSNEVGDVRASIVLPTGIRYTGKRNPENDRFVYNERANELIWDVGSLAAEARREMVFQVVVIPDVSSVNNTVTLVSRVNITGKDTFTGKQFRIEHKEKDTNLSEDIGMRASSSQVQPAGQ